MAEKLVTQVRDPDHPLDSDDNLYIEAQPNVEAGDPLPLDDEIKPEEHKPWPYLLPARAEADRHKRTLVLDLDETLVHSSFKPVCNADFVVTIDLDDELHYVYVLKRPGVDEFLRAVGPKFEVIIFTASLGKYADPLVDLLDAQKLVRGRLFREACVMHCGNYVKDLTQLGRELHHTVIVDNSPYSYVFQPENAIPVSSWFHDPNDRQLFDLIPLLESLADAPDVCAVLQTKQDIFPSALEQRRLLMMHHHPRSPRGSAAAGGVAALAALTVAAAAAAPDPAALEVESGALPHAVPAAVAAGAAVSGLAGAAPASGTPRSSAFGAPVSSLVEERPSFTSPLPESVVRSSFSVAISLNGSPAGHSPMRIAGGLAGGSAPLPHPPPSPSLDPTRASPGTPNIDDVPRPAGAAAADGDAAAAEDSLELLQLGRSEAGQLVKPLSAPSGRREMRHSSEGADSAQVELAPTPASAGPL